MIAQLERAAGFTPRDSPETRLDKLETLLARGTQALHEAVPLIAALLGIPSGERYPALDLAPQRQKQLTLQALLDQLKTLAAGQAVLLAYEDVHWVDPTTQELLGLTIERIQRLPVLCVVTFRPEFSPPWTGPHVSALPLTRLGRREGAAMVEQVTQDKELPEEVAAQIVAKTDGVPLFIEELTKTVLEFGPATGRGRSLRAHRPAATACDSRDAARLAARPPRPPRAHERDRPDRGHNRPGVLARAARGGR